MLFLLGVREWYVGPHCNIDPNDNWKWSFGFVFFEYVKVR